MDKRVGVHTVQFSHPPIIVATATVAGPEEAKGPLGSTFDRVLRDNYDGQPTWEKTEQKMMADAVQLVLDKAGRQPKDIQFLLAGDLLNQTISANFTARGFDIPFLGLYGACSTMFEGLSLAAMLVDGGFADWVIAAACSHHETAERQYRFPNEQGTQRSMSAQWTATGAAAMLVGREGLGPRITHATVGRVVDLGQKDPNDMGSAMAPAAVDTMVRHFQDTGRNPSDYDFIVTGDLGRYGREIVVQLVGGQGYTLGDNYTDCGVLLYSQDQDVHAGGSGCACSAIVTGGYLMRLLAQPEVERILVMGTGALLSPVSQLQGESIPGIGHAVVLEQN